ncbi:hypothetical protein [cf. Phormidesmis sp. LEGE 11477]|nr:hypothetical protein [cf. Phormidesmis sp. LEGE 11477]MBE9059773.1 hypothetical protein [cf. Phormidesmis sp. LEGE 11477]
MMIKLSGGRKTREKLKPPQLAKGQGGCGMIMHNLHRWLDQSLGASWR